MVAICHWRPLKSPFISQSQVRERDANENATLRRKIEAMAPPGCGITSVYGAGYRFDPPRPVMA